MKEYGDYIAIRDAKIEELKNVLEEKETIFLKYTKMISGLPNTHKKKIYDPYTGKSKEKIGIDLNFAIRKKNKAHDPNCEYMIELETKDLLNKEKNLREEISELNIKIKKLEKPLSRVSSIEKKIYLKMLEGNSITHSVELVTEELQNDPDKKKRKDVRTVWRYYNKLREELKKEKILEKNDIKL